MLPLWIFHLLIFYQLSVTAHLGPCPRPASWKTEECHHGVAGKPLQEGCGLKLHQCFVLQIGSSLMLIMIEHKLGTFSRILPSFSWPITGARGSQTVEFCNDCYLEHQISYPSTGHKEIVRTWRISFMCRSVTFLKFVLLEVTIQSFVIFVLFSSQRNRASFTESEK